MKIGHNISTRNKKVRIIDSPKHLKTYSISEIAKICKLKQRLFFPLQVGKKKLKVASGYRYWNNYSESHQYI